MHIHVPRMALSFHRFAGSGQARAADKGRMGDFSGAA